ncbi:MAG TPA: DUF4349 domain-containing protein [Acidimicrobiia bacterium]
MKKLTLILALGLALAACGGDSGETFSEVSSGLDGGGGAVPESMTTVAASAESPDELSYDEEMNSERQVIRNASLELQADDTRSAFEEIVDLIEGAGGFVASATVEPVDSETDQPVVSMVLRVPADELPRVLDAIKDSVEVVMTESQNAEDVTAQFVDLEARLHNLQALETELVALLAEVREQPDADPAKLLTVFNEVSRVRGEIEQLQGQLNYLNDVVALATLSIYLSPTPAAVPIVEETWAPLEVARESLRNLVSGLQDIGEWAINFAIYTLPLLLLTLGIPLLVLYLLYRWWKKRRRPAPPAPEPIPPVLPANTQEK